MSRNRSEGGCSHAGRARAREIVRRLESKCAWAVRRGKRNEPSPGSPLRGAGTARSERVAERATTSACGITRCSGSCAACGARTTERIPQHPTIQICFPPCSTSRTNSLASQLVVLRRSNITSHLLRVPSQLHFNHMTLSLPGDQQIQRATTQAVFAGTRASCPHWHRVAVESDRLEHR